MDRSPIPTSSVVRSLFMLTVIDAVRRVYWYTSSSYCVQTYPSMQLAPLWGVVCRPTRSSTDSELSIIDSNVLLIHQAIIYVQSTWISSVKSKWTAWQQDRNCAYSCHIKFKKKLPKSLTAWVGCTNVTDRQMTDRQTDRRQTELRSHIANVT